jgi:NAD(P)-dependent dehydrogenase (short-subunit alcohol dehydrogenase family)
MKIDFSGSVVIVTGAAQGNGAALARGFAAAGARVAVIDRQLEQAQTVVAEIEAAGGKGRAYRLDVADAQACLSLAKTCSSDMGVASVLVNNAGILIRAPLGEGEPIADWQQTLGVNLSGPYYMALAFLDQLKQTHGVILNVGSIQSFIATPNSAAYTASKGGVRQLTQAMACELAPHGVRVNAIAPGFIATPMTATTRADPAKMASLLGHIPMKRYGEPEELVGPALMLCSAQASYITGVMLPIDGGYLAC